MFQRFVRRRRRSGRTAGAAARCSGSGRWRRRGRRARETVRPRWRRIGSTHEDAGCHDRPERENHTHVPSVESAAGCTPAPPNTQRKSDGGLGSGGHTIPHIMWLRHPAFAAAAIVVGAAAHLSLRAQQPPAPSTPSAITAQDLRDGLKNPARWLTFSGDYSGQRHSPLTQLTPQNVAGLVPQWIFQTDIPGFPGRGIETSPLVVDGVLYVTGNNNQAFAIDGRTGRPIWTYRRTLPANFSASVCCGPVNRGFAMLGDRLYMGTLDAHLVALDRQTGSVIWDVAVGDLQEGQRHHGRAARRKEQGDHRRRGRRLFESGLHRRVRRADRRARRGGSTRSPARASRAASRGRTPRPPPAAAAPSGSPAATIPP